MSLTSQILSYVKTHRNLGPPKDHKCSFCFSSLKTNHYHSLVSKCNNFIFADLNPFPHIDTSWRLCSRQLFENIVAKEEIAQNKQFLLLSQCFPLLVIGYPLNYRDFLFFDKICLKSSAAEVSCEGRVNIK